MLESTYISDLIHEVRVKVIKENVKGHITFKELSEGEQQLLTVLGLMRFTKEADTLFLLDEPDTHLNPLWKWSYIDLMEEVVDKDNSSQVVMTTHDPLVIGSLTKAEVRIFQSNNQQLEAFEPSFDPLGLGVEGVLTSEFFNLPTSLAPEIAKLIEDQNDLILKRNLTGLTASEKQKLFEINNYLDEIGVFQKSIDPLYDDFLKAYDKLNVTTILPTNAAEREEKEKQVLKVLKDLKDKRK